VLDLFGSGDLFNLTLSLIPRLISIDNINSVSSGLKILAHVLGDLFKIIRLGFRSSLGLRSVLLVNFHALF
jgi:hypothetical protein